MVLFFWGSCFNWFRTLEIGKCKRINAAINRKIQDKATKLKWKDNFIRQSLWLSLYQ